VTPASVTHATIEKPLESVFSVESVQKRHKEYRLGLWVSTPRADGFEYLHHRLTSRRRRKGNPVPGGYKWGDLAFLVEGVSNLRQYIWSWVPRDSDPRMTALVWASSSCKRHTRPLVRDGAPHQQTRNSLTMIKTQSWALDGCLTPRQSASSLQSAAWHQDSLQAVFSQLLDTKTVCKQSSVSCLTPRQSASSPQSAAWHQDSLQAVLSQLFDTKTVCKQSSVSTSLR
jgi:hypothetical protein